MEFKIVNYDKKYGSYFKTLNEAWITKYFVLEPADKASLTKPNKIISDGGEIKFVLVKDIPIGVCALVTSIYPEYDYELSKMGVDPIYQGKGIGEKLATSIIEEAKKRNAKNIYIESNTQLKPAINLYYKLGFKKNRRICV